MFENFKKITIKGGFFDEETTLDLFKGEPLSIVYGRNGSGKTTIARCVKQLVESEKEKENRLLKIANELETEYEVSSEETIPDENKNQVFVFDEDFLRDHVRVERDGLNEIVMLGEQVELDNQINERNRELDVILVKWGELKDLRNKYDNPADTASPQFFFAQIRNALREEDGWAEMDRKVKGNQIFTKITEPMVKQMAQIQEPEATVEELRQQVVAHLDLYLKSDNAEAIYWEPVRHDAPKDLSAVAGLLSQQLERPELNEREKRLMSFLQEHSQHYSQDTIREMLENKWTFCPLCLREAKEQDHETLAETLTHILNEEANKFAALLNITLRSCTAVEECLPTFPYELNKEELNDAKVALSALNKDLERARHLLEERKRNVYVAMEDAYGLEELKAYERHYAQYEKAIKRVAECVKMFNETVARRSKLKKTIQEENGQLARKQLAAMFQGYDLAQKASDQNRENLKKKTQEKENKEAEIKALKAQKERTDIALGYINKELQYVFYSERKVKLVPGNGCYKLVINGRNVTPKKISVGERNVLGLCYFFAMLFTGKRDEDKYSSEYLIVIDDPVSSFDYGNRLGVMSLLRFQFNAILKGNLNSRILVMSHDLQSVFDLVKIRGDLKKDARERNKSYQELENKTLISHDVKNEYQKLLTHVYEYAKSDYPEELDEKSDLGIGNIMRRMMEAFSSFCYNKPFETMMRTEGVLSHIPDDKKEYYENFMCRLTLNSGSHEEEHAYTLNNFTPFFTKEEKQQTAKSVLLFLLYVNETHVKAYLKPDVVAEIESWKGEEDGWIGEDAGA